MSKNKKPPTKKLKPKDLIPDLDEFLDIEFNVPKTHIGQEYSFEAYEEDGQEKFGVWLKAVDKRANSLFLRQSNLLSKIDEVNKMLSIYLDKYPELFAEEFGEINRDMIKWQLYESIKKYRSMIDKIQEIETDLELDMHHEW